MARSAASRPSLAQKHWPYYLLTRLDPHSSSAIRRPRWVPTVAALLGVVLTACAGAWQLDRAHQKEVLQATYEQGTSGAAIAVSAVPMQAQAMRLRRVEAEGEFVPDHAVLLDNKVHQGVAGYEVLMPLRIAGTQMHVLVNRGWVAAGADRSILPQVRTPAGSVRIEGVAVVPGRFLELRKSDESGTVWQNLTIERFETSRKLSVQPFVIEQHSGLDDGLVRSWKRPDFGISKHYGYAVQWFLFCGLIIFLYGFFHVRSSRSKKN